MIQKRFVEVCETLSLLDETEIDKIAAILKAAKIRGSSVWIIGNGGSAATASHFANDLVKMCRIKAIDIGGMTPVTLAFGNDLGWENMFTLPLKILASPGDVLVSISCSGNSANVVQAANAIDRECYRVVLTGPNGGELANMDNDACIRVMADDITVQEDVHSIVCHEIARSVRNE